LELIVADTSDHLVIAPLEGDHYVTRLYPKVQRTLPPLLTLGKPNGQRRRRRA
jgi:hypothetical protein